MRLLCDSGHDVLKVGEASADQAPEEGTVATQVAAQLASPQPKDEPTTQRLSNYKGLATRWHTWKQVTTVFQQVTDAMLTATINLDKD